MYSVTITPFLRRRPDRLAPKPGLLGPPAHRFRLQELANPAPFHGDSVGLSEIGDQAIQGPAAKRELQIIGGRQAGGDDDAHLLSGIRGLAALARGINQPRQPVRIAPVNPAPDRPLIQMESRHDLADPLALVGTPADTRAFAEPGFDLLAVGEPTELGCLLGSQGSEVQECGHGNLRYEALTIPPPSLAG